MKNLGLLILLLFSCQSNQIIIENQVMLSLPSEKTRGQFFFNNFELENIVFIETTNEFLLSGINNGVIFHKDKLIVADKNTASIFVIDANTGKVETLIHRKGRGPGESNNIRDIAFDDKWGHILVFNDYKKLLYFELDGTFIKEEKITDDLYSNFIFDNGKLIFYNKGKGIGCHPYSVNIYDLQTESWEKIGFDKNVDFPHRGRGRLLVKSKNIWFSPVLDFGLHKLDNNKIEVPYKLDQRPLSENMQKKAISDMRAFYREIGEGSIMHSILSIRETDNFILFSSNLFGFLIMNKNNDKLYWEMGIEDEQLGLELWDYYPHDGNDNRIMFVVEADEWIERTSKNDNNLPEHIRNKIGKANVNEESNPILVFYKEKKDNI